VIRRWEALADADGARRDHEATHEGRSASISETMGEFRLESRHGVIDGTVLQEIFAKFCDAEFHADWAATVDKFGDAASVALLPRSDRQRRADALVAIFETAADSTSTSGPADPVVNLVIDLDTFEQYVREQTNGTSVDIDSATVRDRRCETVDGVPVDPREAVAYAFRGHVRRVVVDSAGVIVDTGRKRRLFTGPIRDAIQALEPRCTWLGCSLRAAISQIDHLDPHTNGGTTDPANATVMCGRRSCAAATTSTNTSTATKPADNPTAPGHSNAPTAPPCNHQTQPDTVERSHVDDSCTSDCVVGGRFADDHQLWRQWPGGRRHDSPGLINITNCDRGQRRRRSNRRRRHGRRDHRR